MEAIKYLLLTFIAVYSVSHVDACSCMLAHPQTLYCLADFVMQVRLRGKAEDIYRKEVIPSIEDPYSNEPTIHRTKLAIKYNVKIRKIFKANDNDFGFNKSSTVTQLYSPPHDGVCGVHLAQRTNYLISGKYSNGQLQIDLCSSLQTPWQWVSKYQKKGLRFTYGKNCDCEVVGSYFNDDLAAVSKNSCKWEEFSAVGDCYRRHTTCVHDKNSSTGGCKWQRNNQLRRCRQEVRSGRREP